MAHQVTFKRLISYPNLELAWRRITTGINHQHKRYFRQLYYTYELALNANLRDLHERLQGGSYRAQAPIRVYLPKPSGLQRPLTLLSLEDQIVLQAIANCFALRLASRRHRLELHTVFSNVLQKQKGSIFFFYDWHQTYYKFKRKLEALFNDDLHWIAHFDLAAFYDTISHDLLLRMAFPRGQLGEDGRKILEWFKTWSAERQTSTYGHGIPQGPIASDFLAECFLLPIDEALKDLPYVRYVDDIRIFGSSESEARKAVIHLEVLCRERGLIPQGKKFAITEAASLEDALGMLPSLAPPNNEENPERLLIFNATDAVEHFESALAQDTHLITDKTRARYVLYHAEPSPQLLRHVLRLLPKQPEYIDAFVHYLRNFRPSIRIGKVCLDVLRATPYEYVQGEMWHLLAEHSFFEHMRDLCREAIAIVKSRKRNFATKWGALHFLCRIEHAGFGKYADFVKYQDNALLQALLASALPVRRFSDDRALIIEFLKRSAFEPGIALAPELTRHRVAFADLQGIEMRQLPTQVGNVFQAVGLIQSENGPVDPMGEVLSRRYHIDKWLGWRVICGKEYAHALQLLSQADLLFDAGRSPWLSHQNSFNHALFLALQEHLNQRSLPGAMKTVGGKKSINFGTLVDAQQPFARQHPTIAAAFREVNSRRNALPFSHPYEVKGGARTRYLTKSEQRTLVKKLSTAYTEIMKYFGPLVT